MSNGSDIETRILEMKLDNDEFEKGVRSTIKSLEDLEEKLELKDAGDGFDKVSKAANTVQFSNMERSLDAITDKFSLLGNVGLQALERISNKIVDVGERIIKGLTIDPVMDGWNEFEMKTNSIQTIFGGISKQYSSPTAAFKAIGKELDALNEYADQTIYSFAQMTENVGKFTNQNIGLKTATKAIKGIGNWAALVGADSAQMSRAMYNISQSLGGGAMKLIDWKSIRMANMATPDVQKLFADIALAQGGMTDKKGNLLKKGSKAAIKAYKEVITDFEGSLKRGWLTNDIMMKAFGVLSGDLKGMDLIKLFGDTEEGRALAAGYEELGAKAHDAATQVKTFTQLVGVLKESLGSGWATSFEKLFGGFEKQRAFFTRISEIIGGLIEKDTENRNNWIDRFTQNNQGTDLLMSSIVNLITLLTQLWQLSQEVTQALIEPFGGSYWFGDKASRDIFGGLENNLNDTGMTAQHFAGIIADLNYALWSLTEWFHGERTLDDGTIEKATPAYENAKKIFAGLGSVVMIALNALENFGRFAGRILALFEPLASSILNLFGNVGGMLYSIYQNIAGQHMFSDFFDNMYIVVGPVVDAIVEFLSLIVDLIASFFDLGNTIDETGAQAENNKLGPFIKLLSNVFEKLPLILAPVAGFLTRIVKTMSGFVGGVIKGFPAIKKHVKKEGVTPFEDLKDIVQEFIAEGFGEETAKSITDWYNNNVKGTFKSLVEWFGKAYDSITTFFSELPGKVETLVARVKAAFNAFSNYNYDDSLTPFENFKERMKQTILALFGEEIGNNIINQYKEHVAPYIDQVAGMIEDSFSEVKRILNGIIKVFQHDYTGIDDPFQLLQTIALNFLDGYDEGNIDKSTVERRFAVMDFFKSLEETYDKEVKPIIDKVLGWATTDIPNAFNTVQEYLFGKDVIVDKGEGGLEKLATEHIPGLFDKLIDFINNDGKKALNDVVNFFTDVWEKINRGLFGYDNAPAKQDRKHGLVNDQYVPGHVNGLIDNVKIAYQKVLDWCNTEGASIVKSITDFIFGEETESTDANGNTTVDRVGGLIQNVKQFWDDTAYPTWKELKRIYGEVETWVTGAASTAVTALTDFIFGKEDAETKERSGGAIDAVVEWYNNNKSTIEDVFTKKLPNLFAKVNKILFGEDIPSGQTTVHIDGIIDVLRENFGKLQEWIGDDGAAILKEVGDFILGKEVLDESGNVVGREGGAWQAIQTFLDPIADWISKKGEIVYTYLTTHDFEEMWADLDTFLFGAKDLKDPTGVKRSGEGVLTPIINILQPIADFFGSIGASLLSKIQGIDFGEVWQKIYEFFNGKDIQVLTRDNTISNETFFETKHIDGLFDRLANLFDRIVTFFESDTWKGIKAAISSFWNEYIQPIIDFFGSLGGEFFKSIGEWKLDKGFFENIGTILSSMSDKASTEFPKLLEKFGIKFEGIPELFNTFIGGIFSPNMADTSEDDAGTKADEAVVNETAKNVQKSEEKNKNLLDILAGLFVSSASAEDAEFQELTTAAEESGEKKEKKTSVLEDLLGQLSGGVNSVLAGSGEAIGSFIGGISSSAGPLLTILGVGGTMSSVAKITTSIYGTENKNSIDRIVELLDALGGFIEKITWLVALVAATDLANMATDTDFDPLKHVFDTIIDFIWKSIAIFGGASGVLSLANGGIQVWIDGVEDAKNTTMSADVTTVSETMEAVSNSLLDMMTAVSLLIDNVWEILGSEVILETLLGKGENTNSKLPRFEEGIKAVGECIKTLLGSIDWKTILAPIVLQIAGTGGLNFINAVLFSKTKLRTRTEGIQGAMTGLGDLIKSIFEGVTGILNAITLMSLFTDPDDVMAKMDKIKEILGVVPWILGTMAATLAAFAAVNFSNALKGIDFQTDVFGTTLKTGGAEFLGADASKYKFLTKVGGFAKIALLVLAFADLVLFVANRNIQRLAPTLYVAATLISNGINAFKNIDTSAQNNAGESIRTAVDMLNRLGGWSKKPGSDPMGNSTKFRDAMSNVSLGFRMITKGMDGYDPNSTALIDALGQMNDAWNYLSTANEGKGFDVADFQAKLSILQYAGMNISSVSESFRSVSEEDVGHVATVVNFMRNVAEVAQVVSTIYGLGSLGTQMNFGYDAGLGSMMSFLKELSYVGTVSKDAATGNIDGIDELDPEKIRGVFITMIEALPDPDENKELFDKLHSFIDAGGGNLGLFVNGFTGLNRALERYSEVMYLIGTDNFTNQANALAQIDQLGQSMTTDYKFLSNGSVGNMNTRLGTFATDLSHLAESMLTLGQNAKEINKDGDVLGDISDFFNRINNLGAIYETFSASDGQWHKAEQFDNHLNLFVSDFNSLESSFGLFCQHLMKTDDYDFDSGVLDTAATFFERMAGVWNAFGPAEGETVIETTFTDMYDQFIAQSDRLTRFSTALPTLGQGLKDFYAGVKEIPLEKELDKTRLLEGIGIAAEIVDRVYTPIQSTSFDAYRASYLGRDLFSTDPNNPGLFNVFGPIFTAAKDFDTTGMSNAKTAIDSIVSIIGPAKSLLQETLTGSSYRLMDLANDLYNDQGTGLFNVMTRAFSADSMVNTMPVGEIQAYASAFSDLSNAMTMNGQAGMLAQAVDDALNALRDKEIEVRVTPVWNLPDNMPDGSVTPSWSTRPNISNDYSATTIQNIVFPDVQTVHLVPEDLTAITRSVSDAGIEVAGHVDSMSSTIGGLQVRLDTGALVGYLAPSLNRYLGRNTQTPRTIYVWNSNSDENP